MHGHGSGFAFAMRSQTRSLCKQLVATTKQHRDRLLVRCRRKTPTISTYVATGGRGEPVGLKVASHIVPARPPAKCLKHLPLAPGQAPMPRTAGGASEDARAKHARYALGCKAVWVLVHVAAIYLMLHLDTQIHREQQEGPPWSQYFLATMLLLNSVLYIALCTLRPRKDTTKSNSSSKVHPWVAAVQPDTCSSRSPRQRSAAGSSSGDGSNPTTERTPLAAAFSIGVHYEEGSDPEHCRACDSSKALRTHHCSMCRQCVPGYDHHCVWVGRCIGRHNHGIFWLFLLTQTTLAVFSLHQFLTCMRHSGQIAWGRQQWLGMASTMFFLVAATLIGGLLFFHTYLLTTNQTSKEVLAREAVPYLQQYPLEVAPFHAGCCLNLYNLVRRPDECDRLRVVVDSGRLLPLDAARNSRGGSLWDNDYYSCF